jgi:superfamily II DNA or RNA helicase
VSHSDIEAEEYRLEIEHKEHLEREARIRGYQIGYCINRWTECDRPPDDPWPSLEALTEALEAADPVELGRIKEVLTKRDTPQEREDRKAATVEAARQKEEKQRHIAEQAAERAAETARAEAEKREALARWNRFLETLHHDLPTSLQWRSVSEEGDQFGQSMNVGQLVNLAISVSRHPSCRWKLVPSSHPLEFVDRYCVRRPDTLNVPRLCQTTGIRDCDRPLPIAGAGRDAPWHHQAYRKWQLEERQRSQPAAPTTDEQPEPPPHHEAPVRPPAPTRDAVWQLGFCSDSGEDATFQWEEELGPNSARTVSARLSLMFPNLIFAIQPVPDGDVITPTLVRAGHVVTVTGVWNGAASLTSTAHAIELSAHLDEEWVQREIKSIDLNDLQVRDDAIANDHGSRLDPTSVRVTSSAPDNDAGHVEGHSQPATTSSSESPHGGQPSEVVEAGLPTNTSSTSGLYPWQAEALTTWSEHGYHGIAEAVTGAGKTRLAIEALRQVLASHGVGLVLVPTRDLMYQWQRELKKSFPNTPVRLLYQGSKGRPSPGTVLVATVQSAAKNITAESVRSHPALLIADEVHRYGSTEWRRALLPEFDRRLGITATLERSDDGVQTALAPYFETRVILVDHVRARLEGAIAPYSIAFVGCTFVASEKRGFDYAQDQMLRVQPMLADELGIDPYRDFGKFMLGVQRLSKATNPDFYTRKAARSWLKNFAERRRILAEASGKLDLLRMLAPCVREAAGTIIFAETKAATQTAASVLAEFGIKTNVLHSDLASDQRKQSLKEFEDDEVQVIAAPKLLDEGINVPEADLAIVVANSRSKRQLIQRAGRVLRNKADGRQARIVVLYVEGTSEDPGSGTRQDFIEVITPAATAHTIFQPGSNPVDIAQFVNTLFPRAGRNT